jgi:prepilin-type N-terminal cleavage/methylation domain-containing protein
MEDDAETNDGFTLIELSIVLVIIGLIVGGVLVGRDLISAAGTRAQIAQIDKYNAAVNTFYGKYGYLPGDIPKNAAAQFGFATRVGGTGDGDGNGVIEGDNTTTGQICGFNVLAGETSLFWNDLGVLHLIDGQFVNNTDTAISTLPNGLGTLPANAYLPEAKIGNTNFVYVWSGGYGTDAGGNSGNGGSTVAALCTNSPGNNINYFGLSQLSQTSNGSPHSSPGLSVGQAYAIDKKIDDGFPQSGRVAAMYPNDDSDNGLIVWAQGGNPNYNSPPLNNSASSTTCFDNAGGTGSQKYSVGQSGAAMNCALSFRFQ